MIKINYPSDRKALEDSYLKLFEKDIDVMQAQLNSVFKAKKYEALRGVTIKKLLIGSIEELAKITDVFSRIKIPIKNRVLLNKIFRYDLSVLKGEDKKSGSPYQPRIAKFFAKNKDLLSLCSCYFCNIDYISSFSVLHDYGTAQEFLQYASNAELKKLEGLSDASVEYIHRQRIVDFEFDDINSLNFPGGDAVIKEQLLNRSFDIEMSQFTLDHFIGKAKTPLVALSLYNFVPSCYVCNSKFKGSKDIIYKLDDAFLCATSTNFSFQDDVKFQLFYNNSRLMIRNEKDFEVRLVPNRKHEEYMKFIRIFKLNSRYRVHKQDALDLILKHRSYRSSNIEAIARLTRKTTGQVKRDIFGVELYTDDDSKYSKTKFKKDVAENLGIK